MNDVFGIETQVGRAWQLEGAVVHIEEAEDLVVQAVDIQYSRGSARFSPLNQRKEILFTGKAQGVISMGVVIGPQKSIRDFLVRYADPCLVDRNVLVVQPAGIKSCDDDVEPLEFKCSGVLINTLQITTGQIGNMAVVTGGLTLSCMVLQVK